MGIYKKIGRMNGRHPSFKELRKARKSVTCKECIHRWTTNCALYCSTYTDENGYTAVHFNGACHNDDFFCAYGEKAPNDNKN